MSGSSSFLSFDQTLSRVSMDEMNYFDLGDEEDLSQCIYEQELGGKFILSVKNLHRAKASEPRHSSHETGLRAQSFARFRLRFLN